MIFVSGENDLKLFDVRGRMVQKGDVNGKKVRIDLSGLSRGLYIARWGHNLETILIH
jgi:hypothetical protein